MSWKNKTTICPPASSAAALSYASTVTRRSKASLLTEYLAVTNAALIVFMTSKGDQAIHFRARETAIADAALSSVSE